MSEETMRIGEVAAAVGVNVQTLRFYERRGLLPEPRRTESGQRAYSSEAVRFLRFIKRAQELGFTLDEIHDLLRLRSGRGRSRASVQRIAASKLQGIEEKISRLRAIQSALEVLVHSCRCANATLECPILDALDKDGRPPAAVVLPKQKRGAR